MFHSTIPSTLPPSSRLIIFVWYANGVFLGNYGFFNFTKFNFNSFGTYTRVLICISYSLLSTWCFSFSHSFTTSIDLNRLFELLACSFNMLIIIVQLAIYVLVCPVHKQFLQFSCVVHIIVDKVAWRLFLLVLIE